MGYKGQRPRSKVRRREFKVREIGYKCEDRFRGESGFKGERDRVQRWDIKVPFLKLYLREWKQYRSS